MTIDPQAFKQVMAQWASGVTVVTTLDKGTPVGMTVSAFASVSLHPPQVLICVNQTSSTHKALCGSGTFVVHLLRQEQMAWGKRFAGMDPAVTDRFEAIRWDVGHTGAPILPGVLAWLDCRMANSVRAGDHTIFVGEVVACQVNGAGAPLLYFNRDWRRLAAQVVYPPS
jgi:flavin reductase (DIM6/NTAB) family NADH-FMN oxidoreductase RutF